MKHKETMASIAMLSIFFLIPGVQIVNPALQNIAEAFPHISFTTVLMLSTLPGLFVIPSTVVAGAIAGSKVKYKTLLGFSILLFIISGAAPFFMNDFYTIFVTRAFFGIGLGLASPLGSALVMKFYDRQKRANMMGAGSVVINIASVFFMLISGFVCTINVKYTWLVHLTAIIPLILVLAFLSEPERGKKVSNAKIKIPAEVYLISIAFGSIFVLLNPLLLNMSSILIKEHIGNAASAGTILSMYAVGGIIGGAVFGKAFKITGKYVITLSLALLVFGLLTCSFSHNILMMIVGCTVTGISLFLLMPAVNMNVGQMVEPNALAMASGLVIASMNLGGFVSPFYIGLVAQITGNSSPRAPVFVGMILGAVITVLWTIVIAMKKKETRDFHAE